MTTIGLWSFGVFQGHESWNGVVYNNFTKPKRQLASVSSHFDLSKLVSIHPEVFEQQSLVDRAYVTEKQNGLQLYLGHISMDSSVSNLVCEHYSHLQLVLHSSNVSFSGDPIEMRLTALCNVSKNINFIDPIFIPISQIKKTKGSHFKNKSIFLKNAYFLHMSSEWLIKKISFFSKKGRSLPKFSVKAERPFGITLQ